MRSGWSSPARTTADSPSAASPTTWNPCCSSSPERAERVKGWSSTRRMRSAIGLQLLSARGLLPTRLNVQKDGRDVFQAFLWGQTLLFGLLGASLAFFLAHRSLQTHWMLPELKLVLQTAGMIAAGIVALLAGVRFGVEGRRLDLLLCTGFLAASASTLAFSIVPVLGGHPVHRAEGWAGVIGRVFAWVLIAAAPFARGRSKWGSRVLGNACLAVCVTLLLVWTA